MSSQKARKRNDASHSHASYRTHRYPLPTPEVVSIDVIGTMLDEDLVVRIRALEADRAKVLDVSSDARPWEEEIAFVRREMQMRRERREAHQSWVRSEQDWFDRYEASLPAGDFDNSAYVYAATGGRPRWN